MSPSDNSAPIGGFAGTRRVPPPVNEPVKSYAPGSPEKAALKARLTDMARERPWLMHYAKLECARDDVLFFTDIIEPGKSFTIHFTAPAERGEYPYLCTFPGHWQIMNGVMIVE